jgi:hypothetical protein
VTEELNAVTVALRMKASWQRSQAHRLVALELPVISQETFLVI